MTVTDLSHLSGKWGLVKVGKAAGLLGVSVQTLRKWGGLPQPHTSATAILVDELDAGNF